MYKITSHNKIFQLVELYLKQDITERPKTVVDNNGWRQIVDTETLKPVCVKILEENPKLVCKTPSLGHSVGDL